MSKNSNPSHVRGNHAPLRGDAYWTTELERCLAMYGLSAGILPEIAPQSCRTANQLRVAERVRRKYLVRRIREIAKLSEPVQAQHLVAELADKAQSVTDGIEWIRMDNRWHQGEGWTI